MGWIDKDQEKPHPEDENRTTPVYVNNSEIKNPYQRPETIDSYYQAGHQPYGNGGFYDQPRPYQKPLRPNFTKKELENVDLPNQIAKEIRWEKLRVAGLMTLGIIGLTIGLFFVLTHYLVPIEDGRQIKIPTEFIPHPAPMIILMVFALFFFLFGFIDYGHLRIDVRRYKGDLLMGVENVPYFLIRNYKALIARPIYLNWIAFNVYVWGAIVIGVFYIIKAASKGAIPMNTEIIILICILIGTLIIHLFSLFLTRARKGNINAYYGYEIVPFDQVKDIRKRTNRTCLTIFFIFLAIVLFVIVIPWLLIRKSKKQNIIPFT